MRPHQPALYWDAGPLERREWTAGGLGAPPSEPLDGVGEGGLASVGFWPLAETLLVHADGLLTAADPKICEKTESVVVAEGAAAGMAAAEGRLAAVEAVAVAPPAGALDLRAALGVAAEAGVWAVACTMFGGMMGSGFSAWMMAKQLYGRSEGAIGWTAIAAMCGAGVGMLTGLLASGMILTCFRPGFAFFFSCCCFRRERALGGASRAAEEEVGAGAAARTGRTAAWLGGAAWLGVATAAVARAGAALWPLRAAALGRGTATPAEAVVVAVLPEAGIEMGIPVPEPGR